jgi:hypothetical protein
MTFRGYMVKVNHCPLHSFKVNKDGVGLIEMQVRGTRLFSHWILLLSP